MVVITRYWRRAVAGPRLHQPGRLHRGRGRPAVVAGFRTATADDVDACCASLTVPEARPPPDDNAYQFFEKKKLNKYQSYLRGTAVRAITHT